jgi:hypothetical protein
MSAYDQLLGALRGAGKQVKDNGARAMAQCPSHDDNHASLSIGPRRDSKGIVVKCHAGCQTPDVLAAVQLTMSDLFDDDKARQIYTPRRDYHYPHGRVVHRKPNKAFPQSGNMKDNSLFHADRIRDDARIVFVAEGEKDVEAIELLGGVAVCSAMGAGKAHLADWSPLRGKNTLIIADRDEAGRKHARQIAELLEGIAASVRIVESPVGKDAADHAAADKTLDELVEPEPEPRVDSPAIDNTDEHDTDEPTTWEPVDLGPYLRGEVKRPEPSIGFARSDGLKLIYPGRENSAIGETESGKTWLAVACVAVELRLGRRVVYIHYEESDPGSTIEWLRLIGVSDTDIQNLLTFIAPARAVTKEWLTQLLDPAPSLVVHDGVNEAMTLHGAEIKDVGGAAEFKRRLVKPFLAVGAASLACDHLPMGADGSRRDAYGSVHKGNALDGARIMLENVEPFGRGMRGRSNVFITKDRPGHLRAHGKTTRTSGKTFIGTLVVDDTGVPDFIEFFAPKDDERAPEGDPRGELADVIYELVFAMPDRKVMSVRRLNAALRAAEHKFTDSRVRALDDLVEAGRLLEVPGEKRSQGYEAVSSAAEAA